MHINAKKVSVWTAAVIAVAAIVLFISREKPVDAQYAAVKKQEVLETVLASGKVAGRLMVPLSFLKNGTVARIYAREGAFVKAGDTLITLENAAEKNAIAQRRNATSAAQITLGKLATTDAAQVQAQVRQAAAAAEAAQKQFERTSSLAAGGAASRQELEKAKSENEVALSALQGAEAAASSLQGSQKELLELQVRQAQTALEEADIALSRTILRAIEPGRVVKISVNAGELVTPAAPVLSFLPSDTTTHVELQVDEDEVYRIKPGQKTIIGLPSLPDSMFEAVVRDIVPLVDATRGTITVQCALAPTPHSFIPDQTVSAQIVIGSVPSGIALEKRFVVRKNSGASVFALSKGRAVSRAVTARDIGNSLVLVTDGLAEGDTVLFGLSLAPGAKVNLVESR